MTKYKEVDDYDENDPEFYFFKVSKMDLTTILIIAAAVTVFCMLVGCCCRSSRKGRVLSPPPVVVTAPAAQAPYPQQQYTAQAQYPGAMVVTTYPTQNASSPYPNTGVMYPAVTPYPTATPYPAGAPYPTAGSLYPTAGAPYPTAGAPYPAPSAPADVFYGLPPPGWNTQAMPPPYEQATKQAAYNPNVPH